jgi:predicted PurR-regulated permease PerM
VAGTLFSIWTIFVCTIDNSSRPVLIDKAVELPLLLIISGVIGALIGFGVIGLLVGPVVLAVTFTLLRACVLRGENIAATEMRTAEGNRP